MPNKEVEDTRPPVQVVIYVPAAKFDDLNAHCAETGQDFGVALLGGFEHSVKEEKARVAADRKAAKEAEEKKAAKEKEAAEKAAAAQKAANTPPEGAATGIARPATGTPSR